MKTYLQNTTSKIHDMIELCPVDSPATSKILDIMAVINEALQTLTSQLPDEP